MSGGDPPKYKNFLAICLCNATVGNICATVPVGVTTVSFGTPAGGLTCSSPMADAGWAVGGPSAESSACAIAGAGDNSASAPAKAKTTAAASRWCKRFVVIPVVIGCEFALIEPTLFGSPLLISVCRILDMLLAPPAG